MGRHRAESKPNGAPSYGNKQRRRLGASASPAVSKVAAAALVLAVCLGHGSGSAAASQGGGGGYAAGGGGPPPQRGQQPGGYPPQQQQQQPYRGGPSGPNQQGPPPSQHSQGGPAPGGGPSSQGPGQSGYSRGPAGDRQQPGGYRGGPPPQQQQFQQQQFQRAPMSYGQPNPGQGPMQQPGGGGGGGYSGAGGYPGGQGRYGGRPSYPPQQQQPGEAGGLFSRLANKFKAPEGPGGRGEPPPSQGYGSTGGQYGGGAPTHYPSQGGSPQSWQQPSRPGMALQPTGSPSRGPIQSQYQGQDGGYGGGPGQHQQHPQHGHGGEGGLGIWSRFKEKVFQGDAVAGDAEGPPSFRPGGSSLKKTEDDVANGAAQAYGGPGAYGNPYPSFGGPGLGMGMGATAGPTPERSGPGVAEVTSVDKSIVMILKPNELAKKKEKFKQDGVNRLQVICTFDHCLTAFEAKDGKSPCLKTTDLLEQNQHVMLPEAAKKVRFLRSDFKRRMEADGKAMTPEQRVAALEENLRKVYSVVSMEGGVHMNSIGAAIESQLDSVPLRDGVDDMTAALAWRAIPLTIFCAGYGNVAMEVLRRGCPKIVGPGGLFTPHLRLIANFFRPDDTMTIIGMYDTVPLVHEAKKSGATLLEFLGGMRQESAFASRSNVLLLGSELSDLGLASGLPAVEERISVGFLKLDEHFLEKLPRYAQAYDVVIVGDGDMSYANEILHEVVG